MADPAATLTSLLRAASIEDHDEVLKAANAAIKASRGNLQAHHTRVVALLNLDRWDDALRALADGGDRLEAECLLEKAYALYKLGQFEEAEKLVKSTSDSTRALRHLGAQVAYRLEKFQDAADTYRQLSNEGGGRVGEENDLRINTLATHAQLEWNGSGGLLAEQERQPSNDDLEAFEPAYNAACGCIARGDFVRASILLKRSRDLCEASEELSEEQKKEELLPILVQHAYVLARLGKETEAAALHKSIVLSEIPDAQTRAVARNNQTAVGVADRNPFLTQRLTQSATNLSGNNKLFNYQASIFARNRYAGELRIQKFGGVESSTSKLILNAPTPTASREIAELGVISAAARARLETGKTALKEILPMLEKRPNDIGLLLTIIQLYVQTQNPGPALTLLETFLRRLEAATTPDHQDVRFAPGLVAVAVALYRLHGRQNSVRAELARASTHWRSKPNNKESATSTSLLREAGVELLKSTDPRHHATAGATFENIVVANNSSGNDTDDKTARAGLVASFATTDYAKIEPYLSGLTPVDRLTARVDVQSLISAGVTSAAAAAAAAAAPADATANTAIATTAAAGGKKRPAAAEAGSGQPDKKRRKKKPRLPKDYVEGANAKPDPERWLPLRDRSTYRPKGKKGKRRAQEATQGGVVRGGVEEETLELVGGAGAVKVEKATTGSGGGGSGGGGAGGGGGGKKGKKKGRK